MAISEHNPAAENRLSDLFRTDMLSAENAPLSRDSLLYNDYD